MYLGSVIDIGVVFIYVTFIIGVFIDKKIEILKHKNISNSMHTQPLPLSHNIRDTPIILPQKSQLDEHKSKHGVIQKL